VIFHLIGLTKMMAKCTFLIKDIIQGLCSEVDLYIITSKLCCNSYWLIVL